MTAETQTETAVAPDADWAVTQDRVDVPPPQRGLDPRRFTIAVARRLWRWLTSMRTALILLFLLAVAAIPGSVLPQQNTNPENVAKYFRDHPSLAPLVNHLGGFAVFSSTWFSAIYLLLFISLVGCVVPRLRVYWNSLRRVPPDAPARLHRLPVTAHDLAYPEAPAAAAERIRRALRERRFRAVVRAHDDGSVTVSAEKGYLKEAGNLLFHFSLLVLLVGVAFGSWYGWHADRILVGGTSFCSTPAEFDDYFPGSRVTPSRLSPFCVQLNSFDIAYTSSGEPEYFKAHVGYTLGSSTANHTDDLQVNAPLRVPDANVYLIGHGYAPIIKFTDRYGRSETTTIPFLPSGDAGETSTGVATFPDLNINPATGSNTDPKTFAKQQIGFEGTFLPTAAGDSPTSAFPALNNPELFLTPYIGDLGLDNGVAQNVYVLNQSEIDTGRLKRMGAADARPIMLKPGSSAKLPDGSTVSFVGTQLTATLAIRYDPGERVVLVGALLLVIGLVGSLTGKRRRVWFRLRPAGDASTSNRDPASTEPPAETGSVGEAGGLARTEYTGFPEEFAAIVTAAAGAPQERAEHGKPLA